MIAYYILNIIEWSEMMVRDINMSALLSKRPNALAVIKGGREYPDIKGGVYFYQTNSGVVVVAKVSGLPYEKEKCKGNIFGFHIHEGEMCSGTEADEFKNTGMHYNPNGCAHPYHAGDMPPLFGNNGFAISAFLTNRFTVREVMGKSVVIHRNPDDFVSQPSGNAGTKIACGIIKA